MTTTLDVDNVTEFAAAVRRALSDLGPDNVDDLTDGLEADLADKLDDGARLGDPAAYAEELRAAAGLEAPRRTSVADKVRADLAHSRAQLAPLVAHPAVVGFTSFLASIRPLWWVARGWALFFILSGFEVIPENLWNLPFLVALVVVSVQWGRDRWLPWRWSRGAVIALSVIAAIALPALVSIGIARMTSNDNEVVGEYTPEGLIMQGDQVTNIFAYGPDGELIEGVQLFDQSGNPLEVSTDPGNQGYSWMYGPDGGEYLLVPSDDVSSRSGWNVFPLERVSTDSISEDDYGSIDRNARRSAVPPPFDSVQQLLGYEAPAEQSAEESVGQPADEE